MSILKNFILFSIITLIIIYVLIYIFIINFNEEDLIKNIEDKYNIEVVEDIPFEFNIFPKLNVISRLDIEDQQNKIVYENVNIDLSQPIFYYPGKLQIKVEKILFNNLSLDNINISGKINYIKNYFNNPNNYENIFDGEYNINGNIILQTTNEDKLLISFLKLFFEKLENNKNYDYAFSKLIDAFGNERSNFTGIIRKDKNIIFTNDILINNQSNSILIEGKFDTDNDYLDSVLKLSQNNKEYLNVIIKGNIQQPEIIFDQNSIFFENLKSGNNIIEENILKLLNSLLRIND
tara:strand:- start:499 stop:1374 length:876 start_codon:yes stop_codon:yes gene_type:complete